MEQQGHFMDAVNFYADAGCYNHSIRLTRAYNLVGFTNQPTYLPTYLYVLRYLHSLVYAVPLPFRRFSMYFFEPISNLQSSLVILFLFCFVIVGGVMSAGLIH